jgi:nucleotide-binding universal stress UspA family protein
LVPLDGSDHADKALSYALDLAEKYDAEVVFLSVIPSIAIPMVAYPDTGMAYINPETIENYMLGLKNSHERVLSQALKRANAIGPNMKISTKIAEGRPSDTIVKAAKDGNFDIIIMGSRGLGGIKEFVLGSVSHRVVNEAPCPVLIVK